MKSIRSKLLFVVLLTITHVFSFAQNAKEVDLSIDKIFPAVQGDIPNLDITDTDYPFFGGYKYVPKHIIQSLTKIGLPVSHPGEEAIDFDWQLTLTQDPDGAADIVFNQTESFNLSTGETSTILFSSAINQTSIGNYRLTANLTSATDGNSLNNTATFDYEISDTAYGFADKNNITSSFTLHDDLTAQNGDGVGIVTYFPAPSGDPYTLKSVSTYVTDDYVGVINNGNASLIGVVYGKNETTGEWNVSSGLTQSNPFSINNSHLNSIITLNFNPLVINSEKEYLIVIHIFNNGDNADGGRISIGNDPNKNAPNDLRCVLLVNSTITTGDFTPAIWANVESGTVPANTEADITAFSIPGQVSSEIDNGGQIVSVTMPFGTDLSNLTASFSLSSGATAAISGTPQESEVTANDFSVPVVYTITAEDGTTTKDWTVNVDAPASSETDITAFSLPEQTTSNIDAGTHTIAVTVPVGTDVTNLAATFTLSNGATATVGGTPQESGVTTNDFTNSVTYTVTAEDGTTTQDWIVTVTENASTETEIIAYEITGQSSSTIDGGAHTIAVSVPIGTDVTNLVATFTLSNGATAAVGGTPQESGVSANDFTNPVTYTVTAEDGTTTQDWIVTVTEGVSSEADITTYDIAGQSSSNIDAGAHTIAVSVPVGTDVTNLVATFTLSNGATAVVGGTPQESGVTANDFTNSVTYTVTAEDGTTTQDWVVTVTESLSSEANITAYAIPAQTSSSIDAGAHTVAVIVPIGTDVTNLVASFTLSAGSSAAVEGTPQESGVTANDFTNPVTYTVTAEDGTTTQDWVVTVSEASVSPTDFLSYSINGNNGTIDSENAFIRVEVPGGTNLTQLIATFDVASGTTVRVGTTTQESGITSNDFSEIVTYRVVSQSGTIKKWYVQVVENANMSTEADFLYFGFYGQTQPAIINYETNFITVNLDPSLNVSQLMPIFYLSDGAIAYIGNTIQWSGQNIVNFTSGAIYTVFAEDGTTSELWTVQVTTNQNEATDILEFGFVSIPDNLELTTINEGLKTINIRIPAGTPRDDLIAEYQLSPGAKAYIGIQEQFSGVSSNNFASPVIYTIKSQNGVEQDNWIVNVSYQVGIDEANPLAFQLYPNPASDNIHIQTSQLQDDTELVISNLIGQTVYHQKLNATLTNINVANFNDGIYLIILRNSNDQYIEKLIIK